MKIGIIICPISTMKDTREHVRASDPAVTF